MYKTYDMKKPPEYMGAKAHSDLLIENIISTGNAVAQEKIDGKHCVARVTLHGVPFYSRQGKELKEITRPDYVGHNIPDQLRHLRENSVCDFDVIGELRVFDKVANRWLNRAEGNGVLNSPTKVVPWDVYEVHFYIWAVWGAHQITMRSAYGNAVWAVGFLRESYSKQCIHVVRQWKINNSTDLFSTLDMLLKEGGEGLVLKNEWMPHEAGKPNYCVKVKGAPKEIDMRIIGWTPHTKKTNLIGALTCYCGFTTEVPAVEVSVGSGLTDADRQIDPEKYLNRVVTVTFEKFTQNQDGNVSLSQPRFRGDCLRSIDKHPNTLEDFDVSEYPG